MKQDVREKMLKDYNSLKIRANSSCVKYKYNYQGVDVNIYFDAYDEKSYTFVLILHADKKYYFTTLNIMNTQIRKEYLPELPYEILNKIVIDETLDEFYKYMEIKLIDIQPIPTSYKSDKLFINTVAYQKEIDLPFLWHLRNVKMSVDMFEELSERADISREVLLEIKNKGFTVIRTSDINKRRKLKVILDEKQIKTQKA